MRPIYWGSVLSSRSDNRPLPPDLTISAKPIRKRIILVTILVIALLLGGYYYRILRNTFVISVSLANDKIITGDGRGPYQYMYNIFESRNYPNELFLTRIGEDEWVLDVNAWLVSYHGPSPFTGDMKDYVELSFNFIINRMRVI